MIEFKPAKRPTFAELCDRIPNVARDVEEDAKSYVNLAKQSYVVPNSF